MSRYNELLAHIADVILQARAKVVRDVDATQTTAYWHIGRGVVEYEQHGVARAKYGQQTLIKLSRDLTKRFGKGFSVDNLENMRRFYMGFPHMFKISETVPRKLLELGPGQKSETVSHILSWSHYCELLKEDNVDARKFYEIEASENGWSMRELRRQMESLLYERLCLSRNKKQVKALARKGQLIERPEDAIKDPYILEFLGFKEKSVYTESLLEQAVIDKLQHFLLEFGKGFTFVARQKRITISNRFLKCFVLVDFKSGELTHADAGQMNFYLNYFKETETSEDENPPIGIILCSKKNEVFAKYVLGNLKNRIFASRYKLALPTEEEIDRQLKITD
jgi:predicted nuclease of restriction endonuclease-like (RecB) superfamily